MRQYWRTEEQLGSQDASITDNWQIFTEFTQSLRSVAVLFTFMFRLKFNCFTLFRKMKKQKSYLISENVKLKTKL